MNTISNLTLDLQRPNATEIAYAVQNDSATRKIKARLLNGSEDWTPPEGTFFVIRYAKPDGKIGLYSATEDDEEAVAVNGSEAVITLAAQAINVPGEVIMQMNMYNADRQKLSTFNWLVVVTEAPVSDTEIVSSDYFNVLTEQIAAALGGIDTRVEEATRQAIEEAKEEIAAKGQQTKDSIPDDYSALSGEVTGLSGDVVELKRCIFDSIETTWFIGKQMNADKTDIVDSASYSVSDYISVVGFSRLVADLDKLGVYVNGFDSKHKFVGQKGWLYDKGNYVDVSSFEYVRLTVRHKPGASSGYPSENEIEKEQFLLVSNISITDIDKRVEEQKENIEKVKTALSEIAGIQTTTGPGALQGDGSVQPGSETFLPETTDFIPIAYGETITVKVQYESSTSRLWAAYCFYDSGRNLVGGRTVKDGMTGDTVTITIKNGNAYAKYARISWRTNIGTATTAVQKLSHEIYVSDLNDCIQKIADRVGNSNDSELFRARLAPYKPRFCFAKGKCWEEHWNTSEAYIAAGKDPDCTAISADVQVTADGALVMYHDRRLSNQTNWNELVATGQIVPETGNAEGIVNMTTYADIEKIDVNNGVWNGSTWTGKADGSTAKIPVLDEFLNICKGYGKIALLEFKGNTGSGAADRETFGDENLHRVANMIAEKGMQNFVVIMATATIRSFFSEFYPMFLQIAEFTGTDSTIESWLISNIVNNNTIVSVPINKVTQKISDCIHRKGCLLHVSATRPQTNDKVISAVSYGSNTVSINQPVPSEYKDKNY